LVVEAVLHSREKLTLQIVSIRTAQQHKNCLITCYNTTFMSRTSSIERCIWRAP